MLFLYDENTQVCKREVNMSVMTIDEGLNKQKSETLLKLIKKNPTLPIVPMVDYEVVAEDCGRWMGEFGHAYIGEYALFKERFYEDRDEFKEDYYCAYDEELDEKFNYRPCINQVTFEMGKCTREEFDQNNKQEELLEKYLDEVAEKCFKKAIIVNIDLPKGE